jgi:hypothetical protein
VAMHWWIETATVPVIAWSVLADLTDRRWCLHLVQSEHAAARSCDGHRRRLLCRCFSVAPFSQQLLHLGPECRQLALVARHRPASSRPPLRLVEGCMRQNGRAVRFCQLGLCQLGGTSLSGAPALLLTAETPHARASGAWVASRRRWWRQPHARCWAARLPARRDASCRRAADTREHLSLRHQLPAL